MKYFKNVNPWRATLPPRVVVFLLCATAAVILFATKTVNNLIPVALTTVAVLSTVIHAHKLRHLWQLRNGTWWWAILVIAIPVSLIAAGAVSILLIFVDASDPKNRIELIKTGLTVGAGTGGVVALILAGRRQWSTEHDANERRLTELYIKAVEQLGSDKSAVRHGALYALERVAQDNPAHRQTIIDVLCAYLRIPFQTPQQFIRLSRQGIHRPLTYKANRNASARPTSSVVKNSVAHNESRQEQEVRMTAQSILAKHLDPGKDPKQPLDSFWEGIDLDLNGATLINFNMSNCAVRNAVFNNANFIGDTSFTTSTFFGEAWFCDTTFDKEAWFAGSNFTKAAWFDRSKFTNANFSSATFFNGAKFDHAIFSNEAWFGQAEFSGDATADAKFSGRFGDSHFKGDAWFGDATFNGVRFVGATFESSARFDRANFNRQTRFHKTTFTKLTSFLGATFASAPKFIETTFGCDTEFIGVTFENGAHFSEATFKSPAKARMTKVKVHNRHIASQWTWPTGWTIDPLASSTPGDPAKEEVWNLLPVPALLPFSPAQLSSRTKNSN